MVQFVRPFLGIVTGVPCSGKGVLSTGYDHNRTKLGSGILDYASAFYIDKDSVRFGHNPPLSRAATYGVIDSLVISNLRSRNSVLVDATFAKEVQTPDWADKYYGIAESFGAYLRILRCVASRAVILDRIRERGKEMDEDKLKDPDGFFEREPIHVPIPYGGIEIDTGNGLEANVKQAFEFLDNGRTQLLLPS